MIPQTEDRALVGVLRELIPHALRQHNVPGLNIAVAHHGEIILEEGFGYADLSSQIPMTARTVIRGGSMSKLYAATAAMQMVETGMMALYEPINRYLTGFQIHNPLGEREITLYDLLTHRSGINGGVDVQCDFAPTKPIGEMIQQRYQKAYLEPYGGKLHPLWNKKVGEQFQYSNLGSNTIGYLVEVTNPEGLDYPTYIQKHIMQPLGMTSSLKPVNHDPASVPPEIQARISKGYASFNQHHIPTPHLNIGDHPAGSLLTIPGDHVRLLMAYLNDGEHNGNRILSAESVRRMLTPQIELPDGRGIGLIWMLAPYEGMDFFAHGGAYMFGWSNTCMACKALELAIVICTNKWNMVVEENRYSAADDIARFISSWLQREAVGKRVEKPAKSWAWKVSYVRGLMMVEQLIGALGIPSPVTDEMLEDMLQGARKNPARGDDDHWDPEGFRDGLEDMRRVQMDLEGIGAFLESDPCQVPYEELSFIYREIAPWATRPLIPSMVP